ncbi:YbbR-like domain-containing protein [Virgibacillus sp. DJP39]|uniref:CdaR family protein n=1 Tax=Virgibacillus sp. DJP39 TaxID=3409790 RepID=UPI003BB75861
MDKWFKSKNFVRIISLAFAILLYVVVSLDLSDSQSGNDSRIPSNESSDIETIEDFPIGIRINEDKYVVSGVPEHATVQLQGSQGVLVPTVRQKNFDVFVDLEGLNPGEHTVEVEYSNIPNDLEVFVEPKEVNVVIKERASEKFSVDVDFINTDKLGEGFELGSTEVEPERVTITSSKDVIDRIAIVKVFVDVAGLEQSIESREVPVKVYDSQGNELNVKNIEPENVTVSAKLLNPSKTVPVAVPTTGDLPDGYSLSSIKANTDEVEVFATSAVLEGIKEVSTEEIDLSDLTKSTTIKTKLSLPDGARVPKTEEIEVKIDLERAKTIKNVSIEVEKLEDGQDISFVKPDDAKTSVTAIGTEESISKLTAEDIQLLVNAEGLGEGEHQVPLTIKGPDNITFKAEMEQVTIEIT